MENSAIFVVYALVLAYALYRLFSAFNRKNRAYQKAMEKILNSDEYKVKGRHE